MQIDFHHTATYVTARSAGFGHRKADTVAYAAQYVDDAINSGSIRFHNGAMYTHISSAHKMLDYRNFEKLANHHVWIPFHFLPGNGGKKSGENPAGKFIDKIICRPGSHIVRDMVRACIEARHKRYGLHRLGVTLHVLADSWAHQGFAGVNSYVNDVRALDEATASGSEFMTRMEQFFGTPFNKAASSFVGDVMPLGHGAALSYPDLPFLKWTYHDHTGKRVVRNNPDAFLSAAEAMCKAMQRFRSGDPDMDAPGLTHDMRSKLLSLFQNNRDEDKTVRHLKWLTQIQKGSFGFPPVKLSYRARGVNSWKYIALGTRKLWDKKPDLFQYDPSFLDSDWKLFHDALLAHRFSIIHDILPRYGICAA